MENLGHHMPPGRKLEGNLGKNWKLEGIWPLKSFKIFENLVKLPR